MRVRDVCWKIRGAVARYSGEVSHALALLSKVGDALDESRLAMTEGSGDEGERTRGVRARERLAVVVAELYKLVQVLVSMQTRKESESSGSSEARCWSSRPRRRQPADIRLYCC